jgi:hypothetical protein
MASIAALRKEQDLTFIVGTDYYFCPWFVADFISPRVSRLHATDPTLNQFLIETIDPDHHFNDFISLGSGSEISVTDVNRSFLISVSRELEKR